MAHPDAAEICGKPIITAPATMSPCVCSRFWRIPTVSTACPLQCCRRATAHRASARRRAESRAPRPGRHRRRAGDPAPSRRASAAPAPERYVWRRGYSGVDILAGDRVALLHHGRGDASVGDVDLGDSAQLCPCQEDDVGAEFHHSATDQPEKRHRLGLDVASIWRLTV